MRIVILIICFSTKAFSQLSPPKQVVIDFSFNGSIKNENQTYETVLRGSKQKPIIDTVTAALVVNHNAKDEENQVYLRSSVSHLKGDTLEILLFNHTSYIFWEYRILISKGTYQVETWFVPPINDKKIRISPTATFCKINSLDFSKGRVLKGYTKLIGKCLGDDLSCFSKDIIIEGNFRVKIE